VARFQAGLSGNPRGRPKNTTTDPIQSALKQALKAMSKAELVALARSHAPEAVQTLLDCLRDPRHRVAAATALLDRGYGKPQVEIAGAEDRPVAIQFTWAPAQQSDDVTIDGVTKPVIDGALSIAWDRDANGAE